MKKHFIFLKFIVLLFSNLAFGNTTNGLDTSFSNQPDSIIFQTYLDSIEKYIYQDSRQIIRYKILCEKMMTDEKELSNSNLMGFAIQNIYYQFTKDSLLEVTKIIEDNRKLLTLKDVPNRLKKNFQYLDAFTSSTLGDYESAQKSLYQLLEKSIEQKDTLTMYQATFTLGGVYVAQDDLEKSELYFEKTYELTTAAGKKPSTKIHVLVELVDLYIKKENLNKARYYNKIGLHQSDSMKMLDYKIDFLLKEIEILVKENKLALAETTYQECLALANLMENEFYVIKCKEVYAKILEAKKNYAEALSKYEELIEEEENGQKILLSLLGYYESAHAVAQKDKKPEKAYQYLLKYKEIKDSLSLEEQRQKAEYWKIKFDADQKEKENAILTAAVRQEKTQNQLLYAIASIFLLFTIFLFGMDRQKRKYTEQLKKEVKDRTIELEKSNSLLSKSNEELNQLTNILSHDLKEPIRNIVGFSSLAKKEITGNSKLEEYLSFVTKGGKQLNQLIEDVIVFQNIGNSPLKKQKQVDFNRVFTEVKDALGNLMTEKNARLNFPDPPLIDSDESSMFLVFKILIENGLRYNKSNTPTIDIDYIQKEHEHCFLFKDNGIGIAPEFQEQIFGMFKRLNNRNTHEGSGLGLSIVKKVLTKVNGSVRLIRSKENEGSVFEISFPVQSAA